MEYLLILLVFLSSFWFYRIGKKEGWDLACKSMEKDLMKNIPEDLRKELEKETFNGQDQESH